MGLFPAKLKPETINERGLPEIDRFLGLRVTEVRENSIVATFTVGQQHLQPHGIMHGGISCVVGESLGSIAGGLVVHESGKTVVGQSLYALHMRPAKPGMTLELTAKALHTGRRSQIWEINIVETLQRKPIARITLTVAVIDKPEAQAPS